VERNSRSGDQFSYGRAWRSWRIISRVYQAEANNLKIRDLETFEDDLGRRNYRFKVKGKTGERDVILRASAAKSVDRLLTRRSGAGADDWLFVMGDGSQVITLIDQFDKVLLLAGIVCNSHGDKYTLYSLRHFYAVLSLRRGIGVFDVARNMGTSVHEGKCCRAEEIFERETAGC
jgi:integrase